MFKKKQAMKRGGAVKKRGGGMMGPKKKMAKGGRINKLKSILMTGKGNPAGKDLSPLGRIKEKMKIAKKRKPSGRLTADDLKRAMQRRKKEKMKKGQR